MCALRARKLIYERILVKQFVGAAISRPIRYRSVVGGRLIAASTAKSDKSCAGRNDPGCRFLFVCEADTSAIHP